MSLEKIIKIVSIQFSRIKRVKDYLSQYFEIIRYP